MKILQHAVDIPSTLRNYRRWAPWRKETRNGFKAAKVPVRADDISVRLSVANPSLWFSFDEALSAHQRCPDKTDGIGFVMTGVTDLVGIDLDNCADQRTGWIEDWALEIVERIKSYTEFSPSGTGLRIFVAGGIDSDWVNRDQGIECYGGHGGRFLTVTGNRYAKSCPDVRQIPKDILLWLEKKYRKTTATSTAPIPELLDISALPKKEAIAKKISRECANALLNGDLGSDRSYMVHRLALEMTKAGFSPNVIFSVMAHTPHIFEVAKDHRGGCEDRALEYLWAQHVHRASLRVDQPEIVFRPVPIAEYASTQTYIDWFIYGVLPRADVTAVIGNSGSGKTFFVLDMVLRIATGLPWRGCKTKPGRVVYIAAEGAQGMKLRAQAWARHFDVPLSQANLYVVGDTPDMRNAGHVDQLKQALVDITPVDLIVVDTLAQVTPGADENSSKDMGEAMTNCRKLGSEIGATVLLVGHTGKDSTRGFRGWSGIRAALDSLIEITKAEKHRTAKITKMKDGPGEGAEYPFKLTPVDMDYDVEWDTVITSCVVMPVDQAVLT